MKKRYQVKIRETRAYTVQLEAESPDLALALAKSGVGVGLDFVRSETYAEILSVADCVNPPENKSERDLSE